MDFFLAQQAPAIAANINWTFIIAITAVSITAMTAAITIFKSKKSINDDELRESNLIQDIIGKIKENKDKNDVKDGQYTLSAGNVKDSINELKTEIAKIKVELSNTNKTLEELKKDNKELIQRLDDLLKQLLDLLGG